MALPMTAIENCQPLRLGHSATKDVAAGAFGVRASPLKDTQPGAHSVMVNSVITWVGAFDAQPAEFHRTLNLCDRLFTEEQPGASGRDFLTMLNHHSLKTVQGFVEPGLAQAAPEDRFQFERHGFFVADRKDHLPGKALVFNRVTGLKDAWGR